MCNYRINVRTGGIKSISRVKVWGCVHPLLLPLWKAWIHFCILYYHWNAVLAEGALCKTNSLIRYLFVHSHHNNVTQALSLMWDFQKYYTKIAQAPLDLLLLETLRCQVMTFTPGGGDGPLGLELILISTFSAFSHKNITCLGNSS